MIVAGTSYYIGRKSVENTVVKETALPQVLPTVTPLTPTPTTGTDLVTLTATIKTSLEEKKYDNLSPIIADPVTIKIENQNCCGSLALKTAIAKLVYLNKAVSPWDFSSDNKIAADLAATYPDNYSDAIIGIAKNKYVAAFQLNEEGRIIKISLSSDYTKLLP
jgi:hypothetical protein